MPIKSIAGVYFLYLNYAYIYTNRFVVAGL